MFVKPSKKNRSEFITPNLASKITEFSEPFELDRENENESQSGFFIWNKNHNLKLQQQRIRLPIFRLKENILWAVENYQTVIVVGATGCCKTTQIPQYLDEANWTEDGRVVACTQPRRIAASSVAARVAEEMDCELGEEVGYSIRFDDRTTPGKTRIKYMTDGMLIREMMLDPLLSRYSVIMLDEAHERSLNTDILMGLLKKIQKKRPELRLIISSATVDAEEFKDYFMKKNVLENDISEAVTIMSIEGRLHPVEIYYANDSVPDYINAALDLVFQIHTTEPRGHILVFLTGQQEIDQLIELIMERSEANYNRNRKMKLLPLPLYASLPKEDQKRVFRRADSNIRKVIVSTNIAETSVTIDEIVYIIDSGLSK